MEKYLPVGSIISLKGTEKRLIVCGYLPTFEENGEEKTFDYIGYFFPEGVFSTNQNILFNHEDIEKVYFYGLVDEEQKIYMENLVKFAKEDNLFERNNENLNVNNKDIEIPIIKNDNIETFELE